MKELALVLLPTGGMKAGEPTEQGVCRISAVAALAHCYNCPVLVVGGQRAKGISEAELYQQKIKEIAPELAVYWQAGGTMTAVDVREAKHLLHDLAGRGEQIAVVSNPRHAARTRLTLRWLGYGNVKLADSGESGGYSWAMEALLYLVTWLDPGFTWIGKWLASAFQERRYSGKEDN